ncbi:MAG: hypothetical protein FWC56_01910, partial [Phycisphaerae bacterium]|nr:hypothetical protein [Phycisphaerae bacterium]
HCERSVAIQKKRYGAMPKMRFLEVVKPLWGLDCFASLAMTKVGTEACPTGICSKIIRPFR